MKSFKIFLKLIKLGATPPSIIYPYPIIPFLAFALSKGSFINFLVSLLFVSTYCSAVNLWNHFNDAEDDVKAGRKDSALLLELGYKSVVLVLFLYLIAFIIVLIKTNVVVVVLYLIAVIITWIYSDKIFIGKVIRRFKEYYVSEVLTYLIVVPLSSIVLWCFFSEIDLRCFGFVAIVTTLFLSIIVLKDIKDITVDADAGYKTLAVVVSPQNLLKTSFTLNALYYALIFLLSISIFPRTVMIGLIPLPILIYVIYCMLKRKWLIDIDSINLVKLYVYSYLLSLILICVGAFYWNFIKDIVLVKFMQIPFSTSVINLRGTD